MARRVRDGGSTSLNAKWQDDIWTRWGRKSVRRFRGHWTSCLTRRRSICVSYARTTRAPREKKKKKERIPKDARSLANWFTNWYAVEYFVFSEIKDRNKTACAHSAWPRWRQDACGTFSLAPDRWCARCILRQKEKKKAWEWEREREESSKNKNAEVTHRERDRTKPRAIILIF